MGHTDAEFERGGISGEPEFGGGEGEGAGGGQIEDGGKDGPGDAFAVDLQAIDGFLSGEEADGSSGRQPNGGIDGGGGEGEAADLDAGFGEPGLIGLELLAAEDADENLGAI